MGYSDLPVNGVDETKQLLTEDALIRLTKEQRFQGLWLKIVRALIASTIAWLIWKPFGTLVAIIALGESREPLQRCSPFWSPLAAILVGAVVGISVSMVVSILAYFSAHSIWARCFFGLEGFLAATYFGFGVNPNYYSRTQWQHKLALAQMVSVGSYVLTTGVFWLCRFSLLRHLGI
jgi:hypothetical protein